MTLIVSALSAQGIVLMSDGLMTTSGGELTWEELKSLWESNGVNENSTDPCISPNDIQQKVKEVGKTRDFRLQSENGAQKTFRLSAHTALQAAGNADIEGKPIGEIVKEIQQIISDGNVVDAHEVKKICFEFLKSYLNKNLDVYETCQFIFSAYDISNNGVWHTKFMVAEAKEFDENGRILMVEGRPVTKKVFIERENISTLLVAGWDKPLNSLLTFYNNFEFENTPPVFPLALSEAFEVAKNIMNIAVAIEKLSNKVPGIGGRIQTYILAKDGFIEVVDSVSLINVD